MKKQKIYSCLVLVVFSCFFYLFFMMFKSSLLFESNRAIISVKDSLVGSSLDIDRPQLGGSYLHETYIQDPANVEMYLRASLFNVGNKSEELISTYEQLLMRRPSWPYYFSGMAHVSQLSKVNSVNYINSAMKYGKYERSVINSLAEIVFHDWDMIEESARLVILNHLSRQQEGVISLTINISAKFAKLYQYCDFLYEINHVEYAACKRNYWEPLSE